MKSINWFFAVKQSSFLFSLAVVVLISGCAMRTYHTSPPPMPTPAEPLVGAVVANAQPTRFVWQATRNTEYYDFHIFDRTSGDIQRYYRAELSPASVCGGGFCSVTLTLSMPADKGHAWRVRASNSAGDSGWTRSLFQIAE